jgi:hypothetical protein
VIAGSQGRRGQGLRGAQGRAPSARCRWRCRRRSTRADEAGGRAPARALAGRGDRAPRIPVVNNIDVACETEPDAIRDALYRQAFGPVRWVEVVQALRRAASRTSSNAARARCWPAWSSASMPTGCRPPCSTRPRWPRPGGCWHERHTPGGARHRRLARHRPRHRAPRWPAQGFKVIGTATTEAGAAAITEALAATRAAGHVPERERRRGARRRHRRHRQGRTAACTCWSTTPASRATRWPCA